MSITGGSDYHSGRALGWGPRSGETQLSGAILTKLIPRVQSSRKDSANDFFSFLLFALGINAKSVNFLCAMSFRGSEISVKVITLVPGVVPVLLIMCVVNINRLKRVKVSLKIKAWHRANLLWYWGKQRKSDRWYLNNELILTSSPMRIGKIWMNMNIPLD